MTVGKLSIMVAVDRDGKERGSIQQPQHTRTYTRSHVHTREVGEMSSKLAVTNGRDAIEIKRRRLARSPRAHWESHAAMLGRLSAPVPWDGTRPDRANVSCILAHSLHVESSDVVAERR